MHLGRQPELRPQQLMSRCPVLLTSSLLRTFLWYMRSYMKRFFSQWMRLIFQVSSALRLPSCSSLTASFICSKGAEF